MNTVILLYKKFLVSHSEYWDTVFVGLGKVQSDRLEDANYYILLRTLFRSKNESWKAYEYLKHRRYYQALVLI